jgi:hypothetical protein
LIYVQVNAPLYMGSRYLQYMHRTLGVSRQHIFTLAKWFLN